MSEKKAVPQENQAINTNFETSQVSLTAVADLPEGAAGSEQEETSFVFESEMDANSESSADQNPEDGIEQSDDALPLIMSIDELEKKVHAHLNKMGFVWK